MSRRKHRKTIGEDIERTISGVKAYALYIRDEDPATEKLFDDVLRLLYLYKYNIPWIEGAEPVATPDKLPCDWCDRDILVQEKTFNLAGREINRTLDYHYCPMCGRELRTPLSLAKKINTAVASEINAEILIDPNCSVDEEEVKRFLISELASNVEKNIEENIVYKEVKTPFGKALRGTIGLAIRKKNKDE